MYARGTRAFELFLVAMVMVMIDTPSMNAATASGRNKSCYLCPMR